MIKIFGIALAIVALFMFINTIAVANRAEKVMNNFNMMQSDFNKEFQETKQQVDKAREEMQNSR